MSEKEMVALNAWIAKNVMGWKKLEKPFDIVAGTFFDSGSEVLIHERGNHIKLFAPTTDRAASMEVLVKLVDNDDVTIRAIANQFLVSTADDPDKAPNRNIVKAGTLPLAICLFAKKIYEKEN